MHKMIYQVYKTWWWLALCFVCCLSSLITLQAMQMCM